MTDATQGPGAADKDTAALVAQEAVYLIWKQGAYYRPNSRGYTTSAIQAGRYTLADAISITHPNGPDGPRDGMGYVHEGEVTDEDWQAYQAQAAEIATLKMCSDEAEREVAALRVQRDTAEAAFAAALARVKALEGAMQALDGEIKGYGFGEDGEMRRMIAAALKGGA